MYNPQDGDTEDTKYSQCNTRPTKRQHIKIINNEEKFPPLPTEVATMLLNPIAQGQTQQSRTHEITSKEARATLCKENKEETEKMVKDMLKNNNRKIKQQIKADIVHAVKENNRNQASHITELKTMLQVLTHHVNVPVNGQDNHNATSSEQSENTRARVE
eukprot:15343109-Ditylum_brightwellii.AAC.1